MPNDGETATAPDHCRDLLAEQSLEDRIQILRTVAPDKVDALGLILDDVLRMEWDRMGPPYGTGPKRDGGDR